MNKVRILKLLAVALLALVLNQGGAAALPAAEDDVNVKEAPVSFANPAAVYCIELGYSYQVEETPAGQVGYCQFPDGLSCDAWDFLNGKCGQANSICAREGYGIETRSEGGTFTPEYAVCVDGRGAEVASVASLSDLFRKSTDGCGAKAPEISVDEEAEPLPEGDARSLPTSFDWRNRPAGNYLTNVRDQGQCGSCWAFSAVGTTEAAMNIANNKVGNNYDLSEEYLVSSCHTSAWGYQNCCGGWKDISLTYIKTNGIPDEACMPYVDGNYTNGCSCDGGTCDTNCTYRTGGDCSDRTCSNRCSNWSTRLKKISTTGKVATDRTSIKTALVNKGPLAVSLNMSGSFNANKVFTCTDDNSTNHAVAIVGYNDAGQYWIVRNSWGSSWNGNGYFNVGYGECAIEKYVYYATVSGGSSTVPTPIAPSGTITDRTPTYKWSKVAGATQYRYQVMKGTTTVYTKTVAASACGTTNCTNTPTTALAYAAHKWRVQAMVGGAWKAYSPYKTFTVSSSTGKPKAGFWESTTGDEFYVTSSQTQVDDFAIYINVTGCGSYKITHTAPVTISSNKFSFTGSFHANGTFDSTTAEHGTDGLDSFYISGCGYVSGGPWSYSAVWKNADQAADLGDETDVVVIQGPDILQGLDKFYHTIETIVAP